MKDNCRRKGARRGFETLELCFTLPIFVLLILVTIGYVRTSIRRCCVTHAAIVGAREAEKGADIHQITRTVNRVLSTCKMAVTDRPGSGGKVSMRNGRGDEFEFGDPEWIKVGFGDFRPGEACVSLCLSTASSSTEGRSRTFCPSLSIFFGSAICASSAVGIESEFPGKPDDRLSTATRHACRNWKRSS